MPQIQMLQFNTFEQNATQILRPGDFIFTANPSGQGGLGQKLIKFGQLFFRAHYHDNDDDGMSHYQFGHVVIVTRSRKFTGYYESLTISESTHPFSQEISLEDFFQKRRGTNMVVFRINSILVEKLNENAIFYANCQIPYMTPLHNFSTLWPIEKKTSGQCNPIMNLQNGFPKPPPNSMNCSTFIPLVYNATIKQLFPWGGPYALFPETHDWSGVSPYDVYHDCKRRESEGSMMRLFHVLN